MLRAKRTGPEVELSGSAIDLKNLVNKLALSNNEVYEIELDRKHNPLPYKEMLSKIVVKICDHEKMLIEVIGDKLVLSLNDKTCENLSKNLKQFADNGMSGDHFHYDSLSFEDIIDESSVDLVIGLK